MSILIIRGPHSASPDAPLTDRLRHGVLDALSLHASGIGRVIAVRDCGTAIELAACLHAANAPDIELVLLDPGELQDDDCRDAAPALRHALDHLDAPYVEVHDDCDHALEPRVLPQHGPMVTVVIHHDLARSYEMAMSIALRRLAALDASRCADMRRLAA